eukprot:9453665-Karenia_brevis.AAC.1
MEISGGELPHILFLDANSWTPIPDDVCIGRFGYDRPSPTSPCFGRFINGLGSILVNTSENSMCPDTHHGTYFWSADHPPVRSDYIMCCPTCR